MIRGIPLIGISEVFTSFCQPISSIVDVLPIFIFALTIEEILYHYYRFSATQDCCPTPCLPGSCIRSFSRSCSNNPRQARFPSACSGWRRFTFRLHTLPPKQMGYVLSKPDRFLPARQMFLSYNTNSHQVNDAATGKSGLRENLGSDDGTFCGNTFCIAGKSDVIRAQIIRKMLRAIDSAFTQKASTAVSAS